MILDQKKLADQREFLYSWKDSGARGSLVATTGYGKTTVGILAIQEMNQKHPDRVTHVVVPTLSLKRQWEGNICTWELRNVEVFVINTYIKENHFPHLLVLDEIHRYAAKSFSQVFTKCNYQFILGLTATMERQDGKHAMIALYAPVIRTISLKEAHTNGYVSDFIVFNLGINLSHKEMAAYQEIDRQFNNYFDLFDRDFTKAINALKNPSFREFIAKATNKTSSKVLVEAINFSRVLHRRKTFLEDVPAKLNAVRDIYTQFGIKMIVFAETTSFANRVVEAIGDVSFAYHSAVKNKKKMKEQLDIFRTGTMYRVISAVKAIEEGLDVPDLEMVILVSGNSTKRQYIQRMGRSLRVMPGKTATIINIYINETQDKSWLQRRQFSNETNIYWVNSIDQIRKFVNQIKDGNTVQEKSDKHPYDHSQHSGTDNNTFRNQCFRK